MSAIVNANFVVYLIVCGAAIFVGLDLKRLSSWLFGLYGFISGFLFGLLKADASGGLLLGALFAFVVIYGGATSMWHRQRYKK
jgi:hypothetical protein